MKNKFRYKIKTETEYGSYEDKWILNYPFYDKPLFYDVNAMAFDNKTKVSTRFKKIFKNVRRATAQLRYISNQLVDSNPKPLIDHLSTIAFYSDRIHWFKNYFRRNDLIYERYPALYELATSSQIILDLLGFYESFYLEKIEFEDNKYFMNLMLNDSEKIYYEILKEEKSMESSSDPEIKKRKKVELISSVLKRILNDKKFKNNSYIKRLKASKNNTFSDMCLKLEKSYYTFIKRRTNVKSNKL
ncbi:MAG TPA: hypothetical protein VHP32_06785 [Ignavibacteria bacterium]|nr:hypothetical protein [Ignavibacteria bacterium]